MRSFFLAGKPFSNSEASLFIDFKRNPNMITDWDHPDFNEEIFKSFDHAFP